MSDFPSLRYGMSDVRRAGDALRATVPFGTAEQQREALSIFAIGNGFRDSHAFPMKRVRAELGGHLLRRSGITAARLKRMSSIRRKLDARPGNLNQIQDLAGCRVIVPSIEDVRRVVDYNREHSVHVWFKDFDYIAAPKVDGYRCFHRVYKFKADGNGEAPFADRRVEVQVRTRLQHSWATAVESVGIFRGEDFKAGSAGCGGRAREPQPGVQLHGTVRLRGENQVFPHRLQEGLGPGPGPAL